MNNDPLYIARILLAINRYISEYLLKVVSCVIQKKIEKSPVQSETGITVPCFKLIEN